MGEIKFVGSLLLLTVFGVSLIIFAVSFGYDNNAYINLDNIDGFNDTSQEIIGNLSQYHTEVINSSESFYKSEVQEGETVRTGGQFKLGPFTALTTGTTVMKQSFRSIFGSDGSFAFIMTTLASFLLFVMVLLVWKTWGGRNPE